MRQLTPLPKDPAPRSYREGLIEQIRRDLETLRGHIDPEVPGREFYEIRVAAYRETVRELDGARDVDPSNGRAVQGPQTAR